MDELLDGLDCKLRVSGMVADSIMMGIVYSAMEGAFEKACSKEGMIERLNEKSRFCELAVMQLEWGLKFVQEETDLSYVVESCYEREKLISDLKEVRDRMQMRLEETEFAISRKDRELSERIEIEFKLRQALEVKDKELWSLHTNLELERTKSEGIQEQISDQKKIQESVIIGNLVGVDESIDGDFCELKNSVDQQFLNIKQKLEDERINLTSGMRKMSQGASSSKPNFEHDSQLVEDDNDDKRENEVQDNGCEIDPPKSTLKPEVNAGFHKMGSDIDVLKETLDIAFGMMDNAISLSEVRPMEQQWRWTLEKDTISVVFKGFLRDMQDNFEAKMRRGKKQGSVVQLENWSGLMDEITNLRYELEQLVDHVKNLSGPVSPPSQKESPSFQKDVGGNPFSQRTSKSRGKPPLGASSVLEKNENPDNTFSKTIETNLEEEKPKEDSGGQGSLVAEMVRNHESIIRQKSAERNWLRGEILREKGYLSSKRDKEPDTLKKRIQDIILRLDNVIQRNANMDGDYDDSTCVPGNDSVDENLTEEIERMKQEREDSYLESAIVDEVYTTLIKNLLKEHHLELENYGAENLIRADVIKVFFGEKVKEWKEDIESYTLTEHQVEGDKENLMKDSQMSDTSSQNLEGLIREDICTVFLQEMVKEWNEGMEIHNFESHIREEIYHIVLCNAVKDTCCFALTDCQVGMREDSFVEGSPSSNKSVENLEGLIREDIYTVYFLELFKEWNQAIESNNVENHIREEVFQIVYHEEMKHTDCFRNFTSAGCPGGIGEGLEGLTREAACTFLLRDMVKESLESYKSETLVGEEIYETVFEEFIKDMDAAFRLTLCECHEDVNIKEALPFTNKLFQSLESLLREDVCNVFFREMVKEWKKEVESYNIETLISEEIKQLVILEAVKDTNKCLTKCEDINPDRSQEDLPSTNPLSKSPDIYESETLIQKLESLSKCFQLEEDLMISVRCELVNQNLCIDHVDVEREKLGLYMHSNMLIQRDETLGSVRNKLEKTLQQISLSKTHLNELSSSLDMTGGDLERVNDQMAPIQATVQDMEYPCFTEVNEAVQMSHVLPFAEFSNSTTDSENMAEQKKGMNVSRWEEVKHESELPVELVTSLSKRESLYREAFYRRCYDLQKAEAEVDLLGDENEAFVSLLEKIHTILDHYSPVLQHYFGIMEILKLIRKELNAPALVHPVSNINRQSVISTAKKMYLELKEGNPSQPHSLTIEENKTRKINCLESTSRLWTPLRTVASVCVQLQILNHDFNLGEKCLKARTRNHQ